MQERNKLILLYWQFFFKLKKVWIKTRIMTLRYVEPTPSGSPVLEKWTFDWGNNDPRPLPPQGWSIRKVARLCSQGWMPGVNTAVCPHHLASPTPLPHWEHQTCPPPPRVLVAQYLSLNWLDQWEQWHQKHSQYLESLKVNVIKSLCMFPVVWSTIRKHPGYCCW